MRHLAGRLARKAARTMRMLRDRTARMKAWRRLRARLYYALPAHARRNPRRSVTTLRAFCAPMSADLIGNERKDASGRVTVRPAETLARHAPQVCGGSAEWAQRLADTAGGLAPALPDVFLASVAGGRVLDGHFVAGAPNAVFSDSIWARWILDDVGTLDRTAQPPVQFSPGAFVLLGMHWWPYYYHWVLEILPRLAVLEEFPALAEVPLLVPAGMRTWHFDSLALAGAGRERLVEYDGNSEWHMERLYVPSLLAPTLCPSPWAVEWWRGRVAGLPEMRPSSIGRRLYVSRQDAETRRVQNEDALIARLSEWGFERVICGQMSFAEQVRLFAGAEIAVGPHGAGLTNIVFAPSGMALLELFPENFVHGCYWGLAGVCGHEYRAVVGRGKGADFTVDVGDVAGAVQELLMQEKIR